MSDPKEPAQAFWAIVELLGHVRVAGLVSEEERFGTKLGRVDVPVPEGTVTQYFGGQSIYRLTPCDEVTARRVAAANRPAPVHAWQLPAPIDPPDVLRSDMVDSGGLARRNDDDDFDDEEPDDRNIPY